MSPKTGLYIGIGISVAILVGIGGIFLALNMRGNSLGEPVATADGKLLKKIDLDIDLSRVVAPAPASGTGADAAYNEAVKLAVAYGSLFSEHVGRNNHPEKDDQFKEILTRLEEGADKGLVGTLHFDALPPVSAKTEWSINETLYAVENIATSATMSYRAAGDNAAAERCIRAGLIFAQRLIKNGEDFVAYKYAGVRCLSLALAEAGEQYKKSPEKAAAVKDLYTAYRQGGDKWYEKKKIILPEKGDFQNIVCADLWNMAEHDQDRAWQIEGLITLGWAQWTSALPKQRTAVQAYLSEKAASSDAILAKYAKEALKTTREDVHEISANFPR